MLTSNYCTAFNCRDLNKIQDGIGEKIGIFFLYISIFLGCIISAFIHGWELTLVMLSVVPVSITPVHRISYISM